MNMQFAYSIHSRIYNFVSAGSLFTAKANVLFPYDDNPPMETCTVQVSPNLLLLDYTQDAVVYVLSRGDLFVLAQDLPPSTTTAQSSVIPLYRVLSLNYEGNRQDLPLPSEYEVIAAQMYGPTHAGVLSRFSPHHTVLVPVEAVLL